MEVVTPEHAVGSLIFASLLALAVFLIAWRAGYFRLPPPEKSRSPVTWLLALGSFLVYLALGLLILPLLYTAFVKIFKVQDFMWRGWAQIMSLFILFLCLLGYYFLMRAPVRLSIFWGGSAGSVKRAVKAFLMGLLSLAVSYPFVFLTAAVTSLISYLLWGEVKVEQVAVQQLKKLIGYPYLFSFMAIIVVFIVPFMEELLFRGFLQSTLKRYMSRFWALIFTACLFALVHFSASQGVGNFQLIASLFILSLFLGLIYERERTLWAPFALHASFNAFSVCLILFS